MRVGWREGRGGGRYRLESRTSVKVGVVYPTLVIRTTRRSSSTPLTLHPLTPLPVLLCVLPLRPLSLYVAYRCPVVRLECTHRCRGR